MIKNFKYTKPTKRYNSYPYSNNGFISCTWDTWLFLSRFSSGLFCVLRRQALYNICLLFSSSFHNKTYMIAIPLFLLIYSVPGIFSIAPAFSIFLISTIVYLFKNDNLFVLHQQCQLLWYNIHPSLIALKNLHNLLLSLYFFCPMLDTHTQTDWLTVKTVWILCPSFPPNVDFLHYHKQNIDITH